MMRVLQAAELLDRPERWPVSAHQVLAVGRVSDFVDDTVTTPSGEVMHRQYTSHPGAVGIVAWNDDDQVAVVRQYRHPVGFVLIEPPAGLLDHDDEVFLEAAQRELAEEAGLAAADWRVLVDIFTTPGANEESLRVYLARDLRPAPTPEGFQPEGEEVDMEACWAQRSDLIDAIYAGRLQNPTMVSGLLALEAARLGDRLDALRPADAEWPARAARR
jgi:ADP-ribose pyrophosphatase